MLALVFPPLYFVSGKERERNEEEFKNKKQTTNPPLIQEQIFGYLQEKNLSLASHTLHIVLFIDLLYLHGIVLGKCHVEHITEPIHTVGILYPGEV